MEDDTDRSDLARRLIASTFPTQTALMDQRPDRPNSDELDSEAEAAIMAIAMGDPVYEQLDNTNLAELLTTLLDYGKRVEEKTSKTLLTAAEYGKSVTQQFGTEPLAMTIVNDKRTEVLAGPEWFSWLLRQFRRHLPTKQAESLSAHEIQCKPFRYILHGLSQLNPFAVTELNEVYNGLEKAFKLVNPVDLNAATCAEEDFGVLSRLCRLKTQTVLSSAFVDDLTKVSGSKAATVQSMYLPTLECHVDLLCSVAWSKARVPRLNIRPQLDTEELRSFFPQGMTVRVEHGGVTNLQALPYNALIVVNPLRRGLPVEITFGVSRGVVTHDD